MFDLVLDGSAVTTGKPDPEVYRHALERLGEQPADAVAIEDNVGGVRAAVDAGLTCIAFPNETTAAGDFGGAAATVETLRAEDVAALIKS